MAEQDDCYLQAPVDNLCTNDG